MELLTEFLHLREYDSFCRQIMQIETEKKSMLERLSKRTQELNDKEAQLKAVKLSLKDANSKLLVLDHKLSQRLSDEAKAKLEEEGLTILIDQQKIDQEIEELETFLSGFSTTLKEITLETNEEINKVDVKIKLLKSSASDIEPNIPKDWLELYKRLNQKNLSYGVFSRLKGLNCEFCRFSISKQFQSEVDLIQILKTCPGCSRIMLPYKLTSG